MTDYQSKFWDKFLLYAKNHSDFRFTRKNQARYYYGFSLGVGNNDIVFTIYNKKNTIGCQLYLKGEKAKSLFAILESQRTQIDRELQLQLDWQELPEKSSCRIVTLKHVTLNNDAQCIEAFKWFIKYGNRFNSVFDKHVSKALQKVTHKSLHSTQQIQPENEELTFPEGKEKFIEHRVLERDSRVAKLAKQHRMEQTGELRCEVCNMSFLDIYGDIGKSFIEAHHTVPISKMSGTEETKLDQISLVCSNCHRMLHARKLLSINELKAIMLDNSKIKNEKFT